MTEGLRGLAADAFARKGGRVTQPNIRPLGGRVTVRVLDPQDRSAGGIWMPDVDDENNPQRIVRGEVLRLGEGDFVERFVEVSPGDYRQRGFRREMRVTPGEIVRFHAFAPEGVISAIGVQKKPKELAEGDTVIIQEKDILGAEE